jgi:Tfp pilus assembly protein PilN
MNKVKMWRNISLVLLGLLTAQYLYYSFQEMMYQESVANLHRKTTDLDAIKADIVLLTERAALLEQNDQKLVALIDANRKAIWRDLDVIESRLPPVKPIKTVK